MKRALIIAVLMLLVVLLLLDFNEGILYIKGGEFKKEPEVSIESTVLHKEKEVYGLLSSNFCLHFFTKYVV
ncbi:MAG: hypothetical protein QWI36_03385 [Wolbachia endosymbiont of Tyrophagus putrescentiae]|nr:hypothetical protein [Wolbachia endosymbiont of Tyrophagus putrescentiae]